MLKGESVMKKNSLVRAILTCLVVTLFASMAILNKIVISFFFTAGIIELFI